MERWSILLVMLVWMFGVVPFPVLGADRSVQIARLQYQGGGDWYNNPDVIPNLMQFVSEQTAIPIVEEQAVVKPSDPELFEYPILYMTGHGNVTFSPSEVQRLRRYLRAGGFLYADDDYGMDQAFRREIRKVFPDQPLVQLRPDHPLFRSYYRFDQLPRIHEHAPSEPPRAYGIRVEGEWVVLYTHNTNISDGWASPEVHEDPPRKRRTALKFGLNILVWVFSQ